MVKSAMALFLVLLATARLVVEPVEALGCNDLAPAVVQCAPYALGNVAQPSAGCCNELQRVKGMASTTADRRQMCSCLKQYAPRFPNVKEAALAALPQRCGVSLPFVVSRRTNCNSVMIFLHEYAGYPKVIYYGGTNNAKAAELQHYQVDGNCNIRNVFKIKRPFNKWNWLSLDPL